MSNLALFSIVPVEVLSDKRLTLEQMRVLIGLLSFRSKNTDVVWPGRDALAERCGGMHPANISKATSALVTLGWLEKDGNGGRSQSSCYRIIVPDLEKLSTNKSENEKLSKTLAESATSQTVAESATNTTETVAQSATKTVAQSARGIEQTIEDTNKSNIQSARGLLAKFGVPDDLAGAWLKVRKEKRLALTEPALEAIQREAAKAQLTLVQAIRVCCENGWAGFKAHWPRDGGENASQTKQGAPPWYSSEALILAKGNELGLAARPGESMGDFKGRINAKIALSTGN